MRRHIKEKIEEIVELVEKFEYNKALESIRNLEKEETLLPNEKIEILLKKGVLQNRLGSFKVTTELLENNNLFTEIQDHWSAIERLILLIESKIGLEEIEKSIEYINNLSNVLNATDKISLNKKRSITSRIHYFQALIQKYRGEYNETLTNLEQAKEIQEEINDKKHLADTLGVIGDIFRLKGEYDTGIKNINKGIQIAIELNNKELLGINLNFLGITYTFQGEYHKALETFNESLSLQEHIGNKINLANILSNLGIVHRHLSNLDKSLEFHKKALTLREETGRKKDISYSINNIGNVYWYKGELLKTLDCYQRSLKIRREIGDIQDIALGLHNIGLVYNIMGNIEEAIEVQLEALDLRKGLNNKHSLAESYETIGVLYSIKRKWEESMVYLRNGLRFRKELKNNLLTGHSLYFLIHTMINYANQDENSPKMTNKLLNEATDYLDQLELIVNKEDLPLLNLEYKLSQILVFGASLEEEKKSQAIQIARESLDTSIEAEQTLIQIMLSFCELLLDQYINLGTEELLIELRETVDSFIGRHGKKKLNFENLKGLKFLKGKIFLLEYKINEAEKIFIDIKEKSERNKFRNLEKLCKDELVNIKKFKKINQIIDVEIKQQFRDQQLSNTISYLKKFAFHILKK